MTPKTARGTPSMIEYGLLKTMPQSEAIGKQSVNSARGDYLLIMFKKSNKQHQQCQIGLIKSVKKTFSSATLYLYGLSVTRYLIQERQLLEREIFYLFRLF